MTKMMNTNICAWQVYEYFNMYVVQQVFFQCGIVDLAREEEVELQRIYENPMLQNLGLGEKFLRRLTYIDVKVLGLGLMRPRTIMSILGVKLHIVNMRTNQGASEMTQSNEQQSQVESGRGRHIMEIKPEEYC